MRAGIALGSNLGDRAANLRHAQEAIAALPGVTIALGPPAPIETAPVDCPPGALAFLNTVLEVETSLPPAELLARLHGIEQTLGRPLLRLRNASRPIDLDLLYAGDLVVDSPELTLPHPRIARRRFVLGPLAALRPHLILPGQQKTVAELLAALEGAACAP